MHYIAKWAETHQLSSSKLGGAAATPNPVLDTDPLFQTLRCAP